MKFSSALPTLLVGSTIVMSSSFAHAQIIGGSMPNPESALDSACDLLVDDPTARGLCVAYEKKECDTQDHTVSCNKIAENFLAITGTLLPQLRCPCWDQVPLPLYSLDTYLSAYALIDNQDDYDESASMNFVNFDPVDIIQQGAGVADNYSYCSYNSGVASGFFSTISNPGLYTKSNYQKCVDDLKEAIIEDVCVEGVVDVSGSCNINSFPPGTMGCNGSC